MSLYLRNSFNFDHCRQIAQPDEFLEIVKRHKPSDFISVRFIIPKIGSKSFGKFLITYKFDSSKMFNGKRAAKW